MLSRWFHQPATRHADWLNDANVLAYGLARTGRDADADAAPVFASIGRYMQARRRARRAA